MGIPTLQHVKAPDLPAPGAGTVILLAGLTTGRPCWQHQAARLLAECGFRRTALDPLVLDDPYAAWRNGWLDRAETYADLILAWLPLGPWPILRAHRSYHADPLRPPVVVGCAPALGWQVRTRRAIEQRESGLVVHRTLDATVNAAATRLAARTLQSRRPPERHFHPTHRQDVL
ncbi:hypothetical protein ACFWJ4_21580 [Kitasatospora sp. NPDC127067]|uniref:hypothetical protein n=1 Tax=Kitasatospora sp. NPDC127067 TaxID=3347126 RepID=UPI0036688E8E